MKLLHRRRDDVHDDAHTHAVDEDDSTQAHTEVASTREDRPTKDHTHVVPVRRDERTVTDDRSQVRERVSTFAPGQIVSLVGGLVLVIVGLIALLRAGIDGSLDDPVVSVMGWDHSAWLGVVEVGVGVLLMVAGSGAAGRPLSILIGVLMVVAGVLILAEERARPEELGIEREFGWPVAIFGGVVALAALVIPTWRTRKVDTVDLRDRDRERELV
jgi:hypothetical protein